jgi:mevalonate kinase
MSAFAFGKVILLGEHAVVHGIPAIAIGIDRGARATATPLGSGPSRLSVTTWGIEIASNEEKDLSKALCALVEASGKGPHRVEASADLPPGAGLGCSAALGVAIARAIDPLADDRTIIERSMAWERVFHGNPSGVDASVAATGAAIRFVKGEGFEKIHLHAPLVLCIGHSGIASSTRAMVELVAQHRERRPEIVRKTFEGIRSLVGNAKVALETGDLSGLGKLLDLGQMLLAGLLLSTPEIEQLCDLARTNGAYGAKLTGAGGGGSVVALVPNRTVAERVQGAWKKDGFDGFSAEVGQHKPLLTLREVTG